jgi:hypothetical protein
MHIKCQNYNRALSILSQLFKASEVQNHIRNEAYEVVGTPVLTAGSVTFGPSESIPNGSLHQMN